MGRRGYRILAVSSEGGAGVLPALWAAYIAPVNLTAEAQEKPEGEMAADVWQHGDKMGELEARALFPEVAARNRWRD